VGFDHRGFGHSEGERGLLPGEREHLGDCQTFLSLLKDYYSCELGAENVKLIAYGYSMGGATALALHRNDHSIFSAFLFLVPHFGVKDTAFPGNPLWPKLLSYVHPTYEWYPPLTSNLKPEQLGYLQPYYEDPLQYSGPMYAGSFTTLNDMVRGNRMAYASVKVPFHIAQGQNDPIIDPMGHASLLEQSTSQMKEL